MAPVPLHRPHPSAILPSGQEPRLSDDTGTRSRTDPERRTEGRSGRPWRDEAEARKRRFAQLLADGKTPRAAGTEARIDPWRAFTLATDPAFWKLVHDLRAEAAR